MTATATRKPAAKPARTLTYSARHGILWLAVGKDEDGYYLDRVHGAQGGAAFSLCKIIPPTDGQPREYTVMLADDGNDSCECKGFLRHRRCKHRDALRCLRQRGQI